jgi:hypothetical protein
MAQLKSGSTLNGVAFNDPSKVLTSDNYNYGKLVGEIVVTSATTSVSFSGLDGNAHGGYVLVSELVNATASATYLKSYINGDTTDANYHSQHIYASGTSVTADSASAANMIMADSSKKTHGITQFNIVGDRAFMQSQMKREAGNLDIYMANHNVSITNITSLTLTASVASAIGINSRFRLYRRL